MAGERLEGPIYLSKEDLAGLSDKDNIRLAKTLGAIGLRETAEKFKKPTIDPKERKEKFIREAYPEIGELGEDEIDKFFLGLPSVALNKKSRFNGNMQKTLDRRVEFIKLWVMGYSTRDIYQVTRVTPTHAQGFRNSFANALGQKIDFEEIMQAGAELLLEESSTE